MKIALFGQSSFIGNQFSLHNSSNQSFQITKLSSRDENWKKIDFSFFGVMLHVAGIAHVSTDPKMEKQYYSVNRDLAISVAQKAKTDGLSHFVFFSSIIVFGDETAISLETKPNPTNFYGKSKYEAEQEILKLADANFKVTILRLPMVYGQGCKGNFPSLVNLVKKTPVFPDYKNQRSMIYIENLCSFLELCITKKLTGVQYPQNLEYVSTADIIKAASNHLGKNVYFIKFFNPMIKLLARFIPVINKVFGNKTYAKSLSPQMELYNKYTFEESIQRYFDISKDT